MKKVLLSTVALFSVLTLMAGPVDGKRALIVANNVVRLHALKHANVDKQIVADDSSVKLQSINFASGMENLILYNYSMPLNHQGDSLNGFVVLSGDDIATPILAFSEDGTLSTTTLNPAVRFWLEQYNRQIAAGRDNKSNATREIERKWTRLFDGSALSEALYLWEQKGDLYDDMIPRLHNLHWAQSRPYNNNCPGSAITGCVATAFGMIMKYWNYPEHGFGQHSYNGANNPAAYPDWPYGELSADFENTYYDWNNMPDALLLNSSSTEIEAVGTLLYHIGVALEMRYGNNASGCWSLPEYAIFDTSLHLDPNVNAPYRLRKHFGYKYTYTGMRDSIGDDTLWMQMLYNSLADSMPVYYAGWAKDTNEAGHSGTSGHGFLLIGYFSDIVDSNLFYINWGWGGTADGYFKLDAMKPSGNDFTQWHAAVIGMQPDTSYHGYNPADIQPTIQTNTQVYVQNNNIVAYGLNGQPVTLYDIMGRCIASRPSHQGDNWSITVQPGIYIVKIGQQPGQKVIVLQ